jgi:hypothetical protein
VIFGVIKKVEMFFLITEEFLEPLLENLLLLLIDSRPALW